MRKEKERKEEEKKKKYTCEKKKKEWHIRCGHFHILGIIACIHAKLQDSHVGSCI